LQDQRHEITLTRHDLDASRSLNHNELDQEAGLSSEDLLALCHDYLRYVPTAAHRFVWLAYQHTRMDLAWRSRVGNVEFFDGPILREKIQDANGTSADLPPEIVHFLFDPRFDGRGPWPDLPEGETWAAVRVDLGTDPVSDPIETSRVLAAQVVQAAAFRSGTSTWSPLAGYISFRDDIPDLSQAFHPWPGLGLRSRTDGTAKQFDYLHENLGKQMQVTDSTLRRIINYQGELTASMDSNDFTSILADIRALEFVARQCGFPDWLPMMKKNTSDSHAWNRAARRIAAVVRDADYDPTFMFPRSSSTGDSDEPDPDSDLKRVPELLKVGPTYSTTMRKLRDVARQTQTPESVGTWIGELRTEYSNQLERAERIRNSVTHGDTCLLR
jgi:hypothetical protein